MLHELGSSVSIVTGYGLRDRCSIPGGGFFLTLYIQLALGVHAASHSG
jgi:hypothetical protein